MQMTFVKCPLEAATVRPLLALRVTILQVPARSFRNVWSEAAVWRRDGAGATISSEVDEKRLRGKVECPCDGNIVTALPGPDSRVGSNRPTAAREYRSDERESLGGDVPWPSDCLGSPALTWLPLFARSQRRATRSVSRAQPRRLPLKNATT